MRNKLSHKALGRFCGWASKHFWWVAGVGIALSAAACLVIGMNQSVWFDEAYSIMVAKQPVGEIVRLVALDTHPPLYYLLLHGWMALFGTGELTVRTLSLVGYVGTLITAVWLMKRWFGTRAAWFTLGLAMLSPLLMRYGFEVRMYSLASFIGLAATAFLLKAREDRSWKYWAIYAVLVAVGTAMLYNLVYLWATHLLWLILTDKKERKLSLKAPWIRAYGFSVLLFAPQLPTFFSQLHNGALAAISQPMTLENLLGIVSFNTIYKPVWALDAWTSLAVLAVLVALTVLVVLGWRLVKKDGAGAKLVAMYMTVPVALLTLVSLARPLYVERYLSHVAIGGVMVVSLLLALIFEKQRRTAVVAGAVLGLVSLAGVLVLAQTGNFNFQRMQHPNVAQVAKQIDCNSGAVATPDPYTAIELQYYLPSCQIHFYAPWDTLGGGYAPLNKSPLQSVTPDMALAEHKIYFAYYDELGVNFPGHVLEETSSAQPMHLKTYITQ